MCVESLGKLQSQVWQPDGRLYLVCGVTRSAAQALNCQVNWVTHRGSHWGIYIYFGLTGGWTTSIGHPTDPNPSPIYCHCQTLLIRYKSDTILRQNFFHSGTGESTKSTKHEIWHLLLTSSLRSAALKKFILVFQSQNFVTSPCWHPGRPHDSKTCENADETFLVWLLMPAARVWTLFGVQAGLTLHMTRVQNCSLKHKPVNVITGLRNICKSVKICRDKLCPFGTEISIPK